MIPEHYNILFIFIMTVITVSVAYYYIKEVRSSINKIFIHEALVDAIENPNTSIYKLYTSSETFTLVHKKNSNILKFEFTDDLDDIINIRSG